MHDNQNLVSPTFIGIDPAKPFTLWKRIKLLFRRGKISHDGTAYVVAKQMDGKIYIVDYGEFK